MLKNNLKEMFGKRDFNTDLNFVRELVACEELTDFEYVLQAAKDIEYFLNTNGGKFFNYLVRQPALVFFKKYNQQHPIQFNVYIQNWKEDVVNELEDIVFRYYTWDHGQDGNLRTIYDSVFAMLKYHSNKITIFTTNYDKAIEHYCNIAGYQLIDGFRRKGHDYVWEEGQFYYPRIASDSEAQSYVHLYKLHGSLNWKKHVTGAIMRSTEEGKPYDLNIKDNLLIYPTLSPKSGYVEPFSTILDEFKRRMIDDINVCIVIGFSFRDNHVNEVFRAFASKDKRRKLAVISPTAKQDFFGNLVENRNQPEVDVPVYPAVYENAGLTIINKGINTDHIGEIVNDINNSLKS